MNTVVENLGHLFRRSADGKSRVLMLPVDHGTAIPVPGLARLGSLIESVNSFYDSYVVNYGAARHVSGVLKGKGVCLRTDVYKPAQGANPNHGAYRVFGARDAIRVGAHAVMNMLYVHHPDEDRLFAEAAELIAECHENGLPVILEALPFGIGRPTDYSPENIAFAVRAAAELGADVVKTAYPGDRDAFAEIVASCFVPVIVLGGAPRTDERAFLQDVRDAIDAGAAGVAIGRNVWAHSRPAKMAQSLHEIVHGSSHQVARVEHP